ncbi:hypothetical protein CHGG_09223 [Chaetomium globosum CBS 148.51]|jgi:hypothetical protein|uniref:Vacuolar membrane protein n=1 Tax=Chaetomium globosum (strain ATCC 6205 / CBS 148.51 / DSM 1962 / NBRC 6347 / NRRL 1970) TaxID=306901 RepID=Q2GS31_CHAGB|nr:uncharacterized protein CHGG_09223 [Chaetomium globosum CBS 148.51]EAQ85209.1 hypothetical protein CHGG_09223 [Chaetomium globosum CBS 148.51]
MGFLRHGRRDVEVHPEQKWDFISLNDFKSTSCFTPFAYGYLWFSLIISLAVYAVDVFTAYQLLAFNKWSSQIEPAQFIPFDISKWIFTVCILLSFANLAYEYFRAVTIMRRGSVAECFLDSLAARLESIRMGQGRGWKRFLVFAELTKSKKGAEYIALFTFFSFQSWIRTILCSGPRQAINAMTLYSVYDARLQINQASFESSLADFFDKIRALATEEPRQAVILSGMLFTLVIWIFSFLSLLLAAFFFVFFLWSYIPREDGGLSGFCERKVNKRLKQIVSIKINKAMAEDERKRKKAELRAAKKNGGDRPMTMKPSLPVLGDDDLAQMPSLSRADTFASFAEKPSHPSTPGSFEMNALGRKPPMPLRSNTKGTTASQYSAETSLLGGAAGMGMASSESSTPTLPPLDLGGYPPVRTATSSSNRSYGPPQPQGMAMNGSSLRGYTASPATFASDPMPSLPPPVMSPVGAFNNYRGPGPNQPNQPRLPYPGDNRLPQRGDTRSPFPEDNGVPQRGDTRSPYPGDNRLPFPGDNMMMPQRGDTRSPHPADTRSPFPGDNGLPQRGDTISPYPDDNRSPFDDQLSGRASPAPSTTTYRSNPMSPRGPGPDGYPIRSATNPMPPRGVPQFPPSRTMTQPMQPFHRPTNSNGSQRSMQSAAPPYQPYQPYHQPTASNSSLRNMVHAASYDEQDNRSEYSGFSGRPNPAPFNNQRGPQGGYGNSNNNGDDGWNQDLEKGGPIY